eukprot:5830461-Pleurochrysis_carterae.AAC.1
MCEGSLSTSCVALPEIGALGSPGGWSRPVSRAAVAIDVLWPGFCGLPRKDVLVKIHFRSENDARHTWHVNVNRRQVW